MKKLRIISLGLMCLVLTSCDPYFWMGMLMGLSTPVMSTQNYYSTYPAYVPTTNSTYGGSYDSSGSSTYQSFTCPVCKGTGQKKVSMHNTSHQSQWCEICKKSSYDLHSHVFCNECGGDGKVDQND